ncbi:MAG: helix-turn-helix domain-containing protein [Eubacteriales bacterium]|nr:helix-turn-helix domain-containing protein [Eubacteriales bacterium]
MSKDFGNKLQLLRKKCEFTQKNIADALHIDRSTYAYYERGTTEPDFKTLVKIGKIFNVDPAIFLPTPYGAEFDVADLDVAKMEKQSKAFKEEILNKNSKTYSLSAKEKKLLVAFRALEDEEKDKLMDYVYGNFGD